MKLHELKRIIACIEAITNSTDLETEVTIAHETGPVLQFTTIDVTNCVCLHTGNEMSRVRINLKTN